MTLEWSAAALATSIASPLSSTRDIPNSRESSRRKFGDRARVLAEHPLIGRPIDGRPEFRELVLAVLNARYVFRYATDGARLVMLRVFHSRELRP